MLFFLRFCGPYMNNDIALISRLALSSFNASSKDLQLSPVNIDVFPTCIPIILCYIEKYLYGFMNCLGKIYVLEKKIHFFRVNLLFGGIIFHVIYMNILL